MLPRPASPLPSPLEPPSAPPALPAPEAPPLESIATPSDSTSDSTALVVGGSVGGGFVFLLTLALLGAAAYKIRHRLSGGSKAKPSKAALQYRPGAASSHKEELQMWANPMI